MLYTAALNQPKWSRKESAGLLMRVDLPEGVFLAPQFISLGGEARSAFIRPLRDVADPLRNDGYIESITDHIMGDGGRFKLYLATPAVFAGGASPQSFPGSLVSIANGKPFATGGWDLALKAPKPLRRVVPAGSVFFGKLPNPTEEKVRSLINDYHMTTRLQADDIDGEAGLRARMGFGLTLVGAWAQPATGGRIEGEPND
jgi:CRISPR type III-B/RAMP module-associated protein Cmr3